MRPIERVEVFAMRDDVLMDVSGIVRARVGDSVTLGIVLTPSEAREIGQRLLACAQVKDPRPLAPYQYICSSCHEETHHLAWLCQPCLRALPRMPPSGLVHDHTACAPGSMMATIRRMVRGEHEPDCALERDAGEPGAAGAVRCTCGKDGGG